MLLFLYDPRGCFCAKDAREFIYDTRRLFYYTFRFDVQLQTAVCIPSGKFALDAS
jgi:hypothetical protein